MIIVKYGNFPLPYLNTELSINTVMPPHTLLTLWLWCSSLILRWPLDLLELLTTVQKLCRSSTHFHVESLSLKSKGCRRRTMVLLTSCVGLYPDVHNQLDHTYHFWLVHFFEGCFFSVIYIFCGNWRTGEEEYWFTPEFSNDLTHLPF